MITNEKSSVNYTTCEVDEDGAHDYDDNIDPEMGCHHTHYQDWDTIAVEFPGVRPCCPFHGHIFSVEKCQGKDMDGNEATFEKVDACIKVSEGQKYESVGTTLTCDGQNQTIVKGEGTKEDIKDKLLAINNVTVLRVGQKTYTDFCFGIKCDSDDSYFEYRYEACDEFEIEEPLGNGTRCCGKIRITELSIICITLTILQARTETFFMSRYPMRR